jgi:aspartyl-tRNA(Asn)/glutamyl-tRNA(Gln) amidotransferase subunit B
MLGFFVGQVMKASKGQAKPELVNELVKQRLGFF